MNQTIEEKNKALVLKAFDSLFNKRDYAAAEKFWSPHYIQHSAHIAPGREGLFDLIKSLPPTLKYEPGTIVAEGDFVIVHGRFSSFGLPVNWIAADIVRIEDGVLLEHWDVIQDEVTQEQSKSGQPMFGRTFATYAGVPINKRSVALPWSRFNRMRADIVAGAVFPDYELTDHTGKHRKLSDLQGPDPMILVLSRGGYCPKDRRQAEALIQLQHEMEVGYSRLVTISTDNMLLTNEYRDGVGAHWTFLSDPGRKVQKGLDNAEYTDPEHNPMIPHVIVLEPGLVIFKIYNGYWFFGRPTIEELRQDLRAVLKKCRPDWDISRPELKAAWERGEHDRFYPYSKTYGQVFREQE